MTKKAEHPRAPLPLARDDGALRERVLPELAGKALELLGREAREQRHMLERVDLDRHGRG